VTLDAHGWGDLQTELNALTKQGRWEELPSVVPDEVVDAIVVRGAPDDIGPAVQKRLGGVADSADLSLPYTMSDDCLAAVASSFT
jgi:hypothetical protein